MNRIVRRLSVPAELAGRRLDQAAAVLLPEFSRSRLRAWIDAGELTVEGHGAKPRLLLKERLRRAIAVLDSEDASLFLLRHVEGLSIEEVARVFRLEKSNVSVRLHRIRLRLRAEMER